MIFLLAQLGEEPKKSRLRSPLGLRRVDRRQHREHREDRREEGRAAEDQQRQRRLAAPRLADRDGEDDEGRAHQDAGLGSAMAESWSWASWVVRIRCTAFGG